MKRRSADAFRATGYVLAVSTILRAVVAAFIWTRTGAALLVAACVLMLAGYCALWLAQTRGGTR
jgi:hypothetical protein